MSVDPSKVNPLDCNSVSEECPLKGSIYGYYASLGINLFFVVFFGICMFANAYLGWRYRTWTYQIAMCLAAFSSCLGYVGRCLLHYNPYNYVGFEIQICCLTLAPAFNSAAIYLILKHLVIQLGRKSSRIRPKYYTWGFIVADFMALSLQGAGGGIAATAGNNDAFRNTGDHLMVTGISWQVLTLIVFAFATGDYTKRRFSSSEPFSPTAQALLHNTKFRIFIAAQLVVFTCIFIRCVYRIAEMANGWSNPIMQNEPLFIGLDGVMVTIATFLQTVIHPGIFFPALGEYRETKKAKRMQQTLSREGDVEEKAMPWGPAEPIASDSSHEKIST